MHTGLNVAEYKVGLGLKYCTYVRCQTERNRRPIIRRPTAHSVFALIARIDSAKDSFDSSVSPRVRHQPRSIECASPLRFPGTPTAVFRGLIRGIRFWTPICFNTLFNSVLSCWTVVHLWRKGQKSMNYLVPSLMANLTRKAFPPFALSQRANSP